jgi:DNA (cytosine-5)-methyltransferase 1
MLTVILFKDNRDLIQSEKFKVPQRHRVILLGGREDVDVLPATLTVGKRDRFKSIGDKIKKGLGPIDYF